MACETREQNIGDVLYVTTQWPATKQVLMKMKIVSIFGEAIFDLVQGLNIKGKESEKQKAQIDAFKSALDNLFSKSSPEEVTNFIKAVITSGETKREGVRISSNNFDEIYNDAGLMEMYKAFLFIVKANYADFFKGQKAEQLLAQVEEKL